MNVHVLAAVHHHREVAARLGEALLTAGMTGQLAKVGINSGPLPSYR